jgi:hypothetical protein
VAVNQTCRFIKNILLSTREATRHYSITTPLIYCPRQHSRNQIACLKATLSGIQTARPTQLREPTEDREIVRIRRVRINHTDPTVSCPDTRKRKGSPVNPQDPHDNGVPHVILRPRDARSPCCHPLPRSRCMHLPHLSSSPRARYNSCRAAASSSSPMRQTLDLHSDGGGGVASQTNPPPAPTQCGC